MLNKFEFLPKLKQINIIIFYKNFFHLPFPKVKINKVEASL